MKASLVKKEQRELIAFFAAGVAALVGAGWAVFTYLVPPSDDKPLPSITANCAIVGGTSVVATNVSLTCGSSAVEVQAIVAQAVSQERLAFKVDNDKLGVRLSNKTISALAKAFAVQNADIKGMLAALEKTRPSATPPAQVFSNIAFSYTTIRNAQSALAADYPDANINQQPVTDALQRGDLAYANDLMSAELTTIYKVSLEGGLISSPPGPGVGIVGKDDVYLDASTVSPIHVLGPHVQDLRNPILVALNEPYYADNAVWYPEVDVGFQVPAGVTSVQFQFSSKVLASCLVDFSYTDYGYEYFTVNFVSRTFLYTFGVREADKSVVMEWHRADHEYPDKYTASIRCENGAGDVSGKFSFAFAS
jgi:hypothetical protein